jgi:hypothetical protein
MLTASAMSVLAWLAVLAVIAAVLLRRCAVIAATGRERHAFAPESKGLHADCTGGVQSLAFVMTFPLLLLFVLFIVQLSQLLIGVVTVQYAAFAAARASAVWIPAVTLDGTRVPSGRENNANVLPLNISPGAAVEITPAMVDSSGSRKLREMWSAAALACVQIAPSKPLPTAGSSSLTASTAGSLTAVVRAVDQGLAGSRRLAARMANKVAYSFANTSVLVRFADRTNSSAAGEIRTYNPAGHPSVARVSSEIGWQDPVTVTVRHRFALLPGPGRWLAAGIAGRDGRVTSASGVDSTTLEGTATMTIEGLQSLRPRTYGP